MTAFDPNIRVDCLGLSWTVTAVVKDGKKYVEKSLKIALIIDKIKEKVDDEIYYIRQKI